MSLAINPIKKKLMFIIGKGLRTREEICVAAKLPYPTLMNSLLRDTTSRGVRFALLNAKLITDKEFREYDVWLVKYKASGKGNKRKKDGNRTASKNQDTKPKK